MQKKRNFFQKLLLKINNPIEYCRQYKSMDTLFEIVKNTEVQDPHARYKHLAKEFNMLLPFLPKNPNPPYSFSHSGHSGDLIYSLPAVRALSMGEKADFFVELNYPAPYTSEQHPAGRVRISKKIYEMLYPLLASQSYLKSVKAMGKEDNIDYNLDLFRKLPVYSHRGNSVRAYFYAFNAYWDTAIPWLETVPNTQYRNTIILARSTRYNNPHIDYRFLKQYNNVVFLGVESEYNTMRNQIPNLQFQPVNDFLEMAQIIAGCKFFIGNQSFPYSLAEALKVPRLLEIHYHIPDIIPTGENAYDFYFQQHLENLVLELNR